MNTCKKTRSGEPVMVNQQPQKTAGVEAGFRSSTSSTSFNSFTSFPSLLQPRASQLCQQSLWRDSQLFRRARLVPLALAQSALEQHALDVTDRATRHFFETSFPTELLWQHARRQAVRIRFRRGKLQAVSRNAQAVREDDRALHGVLE